MPGTKRGGRKAVQTIKNLHGADFYSRIGKLGGKAGNTGGFHAMTHEQVSAAGKLGGTLSRRGKSKLSPQERHVAKLRHIVQHAELYKLSDAQVAKLSRKFR